MSFELDKIDDVDIYSFGNVEFLRDFVAKNNLIEYDLKPEADSDSSLHKYNTRSRLNSDQSRIGDTLSCYLNKLDCEDALFDPAAEDILSIKTSKRHTRSQAGRMSLPQCGKIHCRLGCICEKFDNSKKSVHGKHCGRIECMFECNCARKLRSSTRTNKDHGTNKTSSSGSICSRSSSNSSTCLRKSKRSKNKVNYSNYSKNGSCSDTSTDHTSKAIKFKPYIETVSLNHTHKLKLKILTKNYDSIKDKILDFIKHVFNQLAFFEWKEFCFSFDKKVNVCLMNKPLLARVSKFKAKENKKTELDAICSKFPLVSIHLFRFKKNSANKENKNPDRTKHKTLPRLLCRKANRMTTKSESKKIFTNLESLLENLPKKYDKISDSLRNYRDYEKIKLFIEEKEFLSNNDSKMLYDPFKDESLIIDCYKKVDSRSLVDSVAETLNDMISVVCTFTENTDKKCDQSFSNCVRLEAPKRRPNVIILRHHLQKNNHPQGKTFVKILNTNEGNKVSIINKLVNEEKPIFKVSFDQTVTTLATIKQNLQNTGSENKKRKRKQDLSFLATKIIQINRVQDQIDLSKDTRPILVSRSLFSKKFKSDEKNQVFCGPNLIKQEPEIFFSDSTNSSENYFSVNNDIGINTNSMEISCENSINFESQMSPRSMLKLDTPSSSVSNTDSNRKFSISSNNSGSFKPSKSFQFELVDSDVENDDDYFGKSSDSTKSSEIKNMAVNLHSVRERQRRLRLKNLLSKLKFALYDIDENTSSVKINSSNFKHSKQATLAEAVETIKKLEIQGENLETEFENLKKQNLNLQKRLEFLKNQHNFN